MRLPWCCCDTLFSLASSSRFPCWPIRRKCSRRERSTPVGELAEKHVTIKRLENELSKARRPRPVGKEVDDEYDLGRTALFRRQELPKSKDGKGKSYTNEEYADYANHSKDPA